MERCYLEPQAVVELEILEPQAVLEHFAEQK